MYHAGNIVDASEIDSYEDYKRLGLVCPYCNEPVFFRKSVELLFNDGASKERQACFVHYKGGHQCELRSRTTKGIQEVEALKAESRNQRLKLFNSYLWDMLNVDHPISNQDIYGCLKFINRKSVDKFISKILKLWSNEIPIINSYMHDCIKFMGTERFLTHQSKLNQLSDPITLALLKQKEYTYYGNHNFDRVMHTTICMEVVLYLSTIPGNYILKKLAYRCISSLYILKSSSKHAKNEITTDELITTIASSIYMVKWIELINSRLKDTHV